MANQTEELRILQQKIQETADELIDTDPIALRDLAYEAARMLKRVSSTESLYLVIEEELIEGYYLVHGDPISVHWNEEDAHTAVAELLKKDPSMVYKVLPVKIGTATDSPLTAAIENQDS